MPVAGRLASGPCVWGLELWVAERRLTRFILMP
jgi:hypothetical protein